MQLTKWLFCLIYVLSNHLSYAQNRDSITIDTLYYDDGQISMIVPTKEINGHKTICGTLISFYENGAIQSLKINDAFGKHIESKSYHENGQLRYHYYFLDSAHQQARSISYYENGQTEVIYNTIKTNKNNWENHGSNTKYYADGTLHYVEQYNYGRPSGTHHYYDSTGHLRFISAYLPHLSSQYVVDTLGQLTSSKEMNSIEKTVTDTRYYTHNGLPSSKTISYIKSDSLFLKRIKYHENGAKKEVKTAYKGAKSSYKTYYSNGQLASEEYRKDGKPYKQWNQYYESGIIKQSAFYNHQKQADLIKHYDIYGRLQKVESNE